MFYFFPMAVMVGITGLRGFYLVDCRRVDSFAAYAYTRRILNAYAVANKRVDNPQKTIRAERIYLIITFNVKAKSKASFKNYDLLGFKCCGK